MFVIWFWPLSFFTCSLLKFNDMSKHSLVSWLLFFLLLLWGFVFCCCCCFVLFFWGRVGGGRVCWYVLEKKIFFDGKSVMSMFCNVILLLLLLYEHVCVTRTGWNTRPRPKTVILLIKKSNQIKSLSLSISVGGHHCGSHHHPMIIVIVKRNIFRFLFMTACVRAIDADQKTFLGEE